MAGERLHEGALATLLVSHHRSTNRAQLTIFLTAVIGHEKCLQSPLIRGLPYHDTNLPVTKHHRHYLVHRCSSRLQGSLDHLFTHWISGPIAVISEPLFRQDEVFCRVQKRVRCQYIRPIDTRRVRNIRRHGVDIFTSMTRGIWDNWGRSDQPVRVNIHNSSDMMGDKAITS